MEDGIYKESIRNDDNNNDKKKSSITALHTSRQYNNYNYDDFEGSNDSKSTDTQSNYYLLYSYIHIVTFMTITAAKKYMHIVISLPLPLAAQGPVITIIEQRTKASGDRFPRKHLFRSLVPLLLGPYFCCFRFQ